MKTIMLSIAMNLVIVFVVVLLVKVVVAKEGAPASYIGTYIRFAEHEAGREWDTLVIEAHGRDMYRITRKWNYERILDGRLIEPEYKVLQSTGIYLAKEGLLLEEESGLRYRLDKKGIRVGETWYQKLK